MIRLLGDDLQRRKDLHKIGVDPEGGRRPAITDGGPLGVWDFLPLKIARGPSSFTAFPHLTMRIRLSDAIAAVTVPNGVKGGLRTRLNDIGTEGFQRLVRTLEKKLERVVCRSQGAKAYLYAHQRHYKNRLSPAETDAHLKVDLRTVVPGGARGVKPQREWVDAIYYALVNKRSNIQCGVEVRFQYDCPVVRSPDVSDLFADTWKALSPLVDFVLGRDQ